MLSTITADYISKKYGFFYYSAITTVPKVVEILFSFLSDLCPTPHEDLTKPPKLYKNILLPLLKDYYIYPFFPNPEKIRINEKRFILKTEKRESGFIEHFHKLPRAKSLKINLFCQNWIDYEDDEDLILIRKIIKYFQRISKRSSLWKYQKRPAVRISFND